MKKFFPIVVLPFVLFLSPLHLSDEIIKSEPSCSEQVVKGKVTNIRVAGCIMGFGYVYIITVECLEKKEEEFLYFQKPDFEVGQWIIFRENKIQVLK